MKQHNLRVSDELMAAIEHERGLVPRNRWLVDVLERHLTSEHRVKYAEVADKVHLFPTSVQVPTTRALKTLEQEAKELLQTSKPKTPSAPGERLTSAARRQLDHEHARQQRKVP